VVKSKISINENLIKNVLTLRYSPTTKSQIPKLDWKDFVQRPNNNSSEFVEKKIVENIKKSITNSKISISLSAGVDSTLMLDLLKKTIPDCSPIAITVKFEGSFDETKQAAYLADKFDIDCETLYIENYLLELPKAISIVKLPIWDLHWYYVAKKARTLSKIIVTGDGGDELFGGYTFRYKKFLSTLKKKPSTQEKILSYLQCHERDWVPDQDKIFGKRAKFNWSQIYKIFEPYFNNQLDPLSQVFLADFNGKLRHNFSIVSASINSHFKIKTVTPLLSKDLIKYATHIPLQLKYDRNKNIGKLLLRQILQKEKIEKFVSTSKQGFSIDTRNLWNVRAKKICDYYLSDARIVKDGWINGKWINSYLNSKDLDVRYVNKFLGLLALEVWYRIFITKEMKSASKL
jgi:asparagine synthase (glutamine-hydrolysing)